MRSWGFQRSFVTVINCNVYRHLAKFISDIPNYTVTTGVWSLVSSDPIPTITHNSLFIPNDKLNTYYVFTISSNPPRIQRSCKFYEIYREFDTTIFNTFEINPRWTRYETMNCNNETTWQTLNCGNNYIRDIRWQSNDDVILYDFFFNDLMILQNYCRREISNHAEVGFGCEDIKLFLSISKRFMLRF